MNEQDFEQLRQAGKAPALDSQAELTAAKDAIRYALDYYIDDEGAAAEILSFVNGYEGSPDLRINATEPTPARRDFAAELTALRAENAALRLTLQEIKNKKFANTVYAVTEAILQIQNAAAEALKGKP